MNRPSEGEPVPQAMPSKLGPVRTGPPWAFIAAVLAIGLMAGFALGLLAVGQSLGLRDTNASVYDEKLVTALVKKASPAVVEIIVPQAGRDKPVSAFAPQDTGSGFFVDKEGHIITNNHVVDGAGDIRVKLHDGRMIKATRLGNSPSDDLALLKVDPGQVGEIRPLTLADSGKVKKGQLAVAIGSPFRLQNFVTVGVVAGVGDGPSGSGRPIPDMVWTTATLLPGNSGGPLLNSEGQVIGVTSAVQVTGSGQLGIGYAIPSNILAGLLSELKEAQVVKRPWLGISGTTLTEDMSAAMGIQAEGGVYVRQVWPNSPAQRANLRDDPFMVPSGRGDVILAVDNRPMRSVSDMVSYFNTLRPGDEVKLTILRGGKVTQEVRVTLDAWSGT